MLPTAITVPVANLLEHMNRTGGYMVGDPVEVADETFDEAERLGLIKIERDGTALLTMDGVCIARWWLRNWKAKARTDG